PHPISLSTVPCSPLLSPTVFPTTRVPPRSTLFPYTTLFRSQWPTTSPRLTVPRTNPARGIQPRPQLGRSRASMGRGFGLGLGGGDRKSTRLNSSHVKISYAVFCLKKKIGPQRRKV